MKQIRRKSHRPGAGFTLLEAMIAMVIIGLTIAALVTSSGAFSRTNAAGIDLSTAEFLIEEVREMTAAVAVVDPQTGTATFGPEAGETVAQYDDLDDFDGATFSPPIDIERADLNDFAAFTQRITVDNVSVSDLTQVVAAHSSDFVRVTVDILMNGRTISSCSWVRTRY